MNSIEIQNLIDNVSARYSHNSGDSFAQSLLLDVAQLQLELNKADIASGTLLNMAEQQAQSDSVEEYIEKKLDAITKVTDMAVKVIRLGYHSESKIDAYLTESEAERIVDAVLQTFGIKKLFDE